MRFTDPSVSESLNRKWLGMPRGVYAGFHPVEIAEDLLELQVDSQLGFSLLKVGSSSAKATVDLFTEDAVQLNFSTHVAYPVYVIARADYLLTGGTSARIFTREATASGSNEVQICQVNKVGSNFVIDALEPLIRQTPVAVDDQKYGFMGEGAVTDLDATALMTSEVEDAREDLTATVQPSLNDRLVTDMDGAAMTDRMVLQSIHIQGNDYEIDAPSLPLASLNVSGSFSAVSRANPPFLTFPDLGSPTMEGVISGPSDTVNNICPVVSVDTGSRVVDAAGDLIFGRLNSSTAFLSGTLTFIVATPFVTGVGTAFLTELEDGDLVTGADGVLYEVLTRTSNTALELSTAYQGTSAAVGGPARERFTLEFVSRTSGVEVPASIDAVGSYRFFATVWTRLDNVVANAFSVFKARAELPAVPEATDTVAGKVLVAASGGRAGALRRVKDTGVLVDSDVHTLNFPVIGSTTDLGGGEIAISVVGADGPPGPTGGIGPSGPPGIDGEGYTINNPRIMSPLSGTTIAAAGTVFVSHTVDFSIAPTPMSRVDHVVGGIGYVDNIQAFETVIIDTLTIPDFATTRIMGEITGRIIPSPTQTLTEIKLFIGAFGA
jgi:hypothetical protein